MELRQSNAYISPLLLLLLLLFYICLLGWLRLIGEVSRSDISD